MLHAHFDFITLVKINLKWVKKELEQRLDEFRSTGSACPFDTDTHGLTLMMMKEFFRTRKYASRKKGLSEGDAEFFRRRNYLHLYFNPLRRAEQDAAFGKEKTSWLLRPGIKLRKGSL